MSCSSCSMTLEGFTDGPASNPTCKSGLPKQGCMYTAQGDVVCNNAIDPTVKSQMQFPQQQAQETFMMRGGMRPETFVNAKKQ